MDRMLTVSEAAKLAGVPRSTMAYWVLHGMVHGQRIGRFWAIPESEVLRLQQAPRPKPGRKVGTPMPRRFEGTCQACGKTFQSARPAKYCSPRCSARHRARERRAHR
jgi:excisionase family DNA binding protein